ncbi:MAG: hypothetical protein HOP16_00560 [Acidobacteria bacterium]|nr:hypothetical protein [Acidobacteriota bacterium]
MTKGNERGVVLIVVLLMVALLAALGATLALATATEVAIAANYREASETLYAAEAVVAFVTQEVAVAADWSDVASVAGGSTFTDGVAGGARTVGAATLNLTDATDQLNTLVPAGPAGASPWVLYAFGRFTDLVPATSRLAPVYVAAWVANHASSPDPAMRGALSIFGQAYGPRGSRRAVEVIVEKVDASTVRRRLWREWP